MTEIKSLTLSELKTALSGQPGFRAGQVYTWLHRGVRSFEEMTDLPKTLRQSLADGFLLTAPQVLRRQESRLDGTVKYLWQLHDGNCVETVLMKYHHGNTVCISSEVGCPMGCAFCASTIGGLVRRLSPGEMLDEVLFTQLDSGQPISNIVLMGIGEPLDNFENVMQFMRLISNKEGRNLSLRHVALSTCGLVPRIERLAEEQLPLTLSVSLHASDNETRDALMPVNRRYPIEQLLQACGDYFRRTGRRVTFEYAVIAGENDSPAAAKQLGKRLRPVFPNQRPHVNLIPVNPVAGTGFQAGHAEAFRRLLEQEGINATVRRTLGEDIKAACGQLRRETAEKAAEESVVSTSEGVSGL